MISAELPSSCFHDSCQRVEEADAANDPRGGGTTSMTKIRTLNWGRAE